jgi:DtxR family Mn-dependent transcriptional regulator
MKKLSKSIEDYLEAILILNQDNNIVHSVSVAKFLNVSKPAVNKAMNELINLNYIIKGPYKDIVLTDKGRKQAKDVYHKHVLIREFLENIGVSKEISEHDCCLIEHVISKETVLKFEEFNKNHTPK